MIDKSIIGNARLLFAAEVEKRWARSFIRSYCK